MNSVDKGILKKIGKIGKPQQSGPSAEQKAATKYNSSGIGDIRVNETTGQQSVSGGRNMYGFSRPDTQLMRGQDNQILQPFRETVTDEYKQLGDYGKTFGSDADARAKIGMGGAYSKLETEAMKSGDLESTALMRGQLDNRLNSDLSRAGRAAQASTNNLQNQMAIRGGVSAASMERMGRNANRDSMASVQGIMAQNRDQNLNLSIDNANRRDSLLRDVGQVQQANNQFNANAFTNNQNRQLDALQRAGQVGQDVQRSNIGAAREDLDKQNLAAHNLYGEDMQLFGASMTAKAQEKAGKQKSGGCCFIFLEARYGNGTMDDVVRRFRDEMMTDKNRRGYYKMSEVLVPLMRKHKAVKLAVRLFMTDPLVAYGKAYYGGNRLGYIFKPLTNFWLRTFDFLGSEHEFIRENGEIV